MCGNSHRGSLDAYDSQVWHTLRRNQYLPYCFDRERKEGRKQRERNVRVEPELETKKAILRDQFMETPQLFSNFTSNRTHKHSRSSSKGYSKPRGTQMSDLFLVYGLKVRLERFFFLFGVRKRNAPLTQYILKKDSQTPH